MTDFGERLRKERESRDVSLREMAEATKIGKRYLEALERNDFDALPGAVFAKGYIRNYAEHLGLDPEPLLAEYQRERRSRGGGDDDEDEQAAQDAAQAVLTHLAASRGVTPAAPRRTAWIVGLSVLAVALIAVLGWLFVGSPGLEPADRAEATLRPREEPAPERSPAVTPQSAEALSDEEATAAEARPEPAAAETPAPETVTPEPEPSLPAPPPRQEPRETSEPAAAEPADIDAVVAEPEPEPTAESPVTTLPAASQLSIPDYGVGSGVVNRQLVGRSDSFAEGSAVWFWTRVLGGQPGDAIRHVWIHEGQVQGTIDLNVGGSHWRTQSRWSMRPGSSGAWAVEARDGTGQVLVRVEFSCVPAD